MQITVDAAEPRIELDGDGEREQVAVRLGQPEARAQPDPVAVLPRDEIRLADRVAELARLGVGRIKARLLRGELRWIEQQSVDLAVGDRKALIGTGQPLIPQMPHPQNVATRTRAHARQRGWFGGLRQSDGQRVGHVSMIQEGGEST